MKRTELFLPCVKGSGELGGGPRVLGVAVGSRCGIWRPGDTVELMWSLCSEEDCCPRHNSALLCNSTWVIHHSKDQAPPLTL